MVLKKVKFFVFHLLAEQTDKLENSNPYGFGLLKGYKDYYGGRDGRKH